MIISSVYYLPASTEEQTLTVQSNQVLLAPSTASNRLLDTTSIRNEQRMGTNIRGLCGLDLQVALIPRTCQQIRVSTKLYNETLVVSLHMSKRRTLHILYGNDWALYQVWWHNSLLWHNWRWHSYNYLSRKMLSGNCKSERKWTCNEVKTIGNATTSVLGRVLLEDEAICK